MSFRYLASPSSIIALASTFTFFFFVLRRRIEQRRATGKLEEAIRLDLRAPTSLHPVINTDLCIGSASCIRACPEGKILGLVNGSATLLQGSKCIGHGRCAAECPVHAITLVFGTATRGVDLPEVNQFFESSRPGLHIVGELAGMGLIKNALIQGLQVAAHFKETLPTRSDLDGVDVAIVGAGPAGLATAAGCRSAGLTFTVLEQDSIGGTVAHYPRQKVVMTETLPMPFLGKFGRPRMRKEDLLKQFETLRKRAGIQVQTGTKVHGIEGANGDFLVVTSRGMLRARRVVLAIGRRGSPRTLGVPGEDLPKVTYHLVDPSQYAGKKVLVVGGGDSALEAACALAMESDAEVTLIHRRAEFGRCRTANRERMASLQAMGRIHIRLATEIRAITPTTVSLESQGQPERLTNDFVIACLGGELPAEFLKAARVEIKRHHGTQSLVAAPTKNTLHARQGFLRRYYPWILAVFIVALLATVGNHYYLLPRHLRSLSPAHPLLRSRGLLGHGIGVLASLLMLLNLSYMVRKRLTWFKRKASLAPWLRFHVFAGTFGTTLILFHAGFGGTNRLANSTYAALWVVLGTGLIGRYLYGFVRLPTDLDQQQEHLTEKIHDTLAHMPTLFREGHSLGDSPLRQIVRLVQGRLPGRDRLFITALRIPWTWIVFAVQLVRLRSVFLDRRSQWVFAKQVMRLRGLRTREALHAPIKSFMSWWRLFHVVAAGILFTLIAMHVWVSLRLGFRWFLP